MLTAASFPGCFFWTIQGVTFLSERNPDQNGCTGHHGIYFQHDDNLFSNFDYRTRFIHDISVSKCSGNVSVNGKGVDLCFDHHKCAPYANLFADVDVGEGTRVWNCGGGADRGKHSAGYETFWAIRARKTLSYPSLEFGPASMNLVGIYTQTASEKNLNGKWLEAIPPEKLFPQDLHQAQLARRLQSNKTSLR